MKSQLTELSSGSLAAQTRVHIETLRYYEKIGLMPRPKRSSGGHRIYDQTHLKRLSFIRRSRELGFTLQVIRELLDLLDGGDYTCAEVRDRTNRHLADVTIKIRDLRKVQRTLKVMSSKCDGGSVPQCPIVDALYSD